MSIIGWAATLLVPGGGAVALGVAIAKFGARAVFGRIGSGLRKVNWVRTVAIILAAAVGVYILILRGELQHRDKMLAQDQLLLDLIHGEVDRGVGKRTMQNDAPLYIRGFVDNARTLSDALDRQNKALAQSAKDAQARDTAARAAVVATPEQAVRETIRKALVDPKRSTGLSQAEWGQL